MGPSNPGVHPIHLIWDSQRRNVVTWFSCLKRLIYQGTVKHLFFIRLNVIFRKFNCSLLYHTVFQENYNFMTSVNICSSLAQRCPRYWMFKHYSSQWKWRVSLICRRRLILTTCVCLKLWSFLIVALPLSLILFPRFYLHVVSACV